MTSERDFLTALRATINDRLQALGDADPPPPPVPTGTLVPLKLLQWNAHHDFLGTDGKYDPDRFANWVAQMAPDVCGFNEVQTQGTADGIRSRIAQRLKQPVGAVAWTNGYDGRGNVIVSRVSTTYERLTIDTQLPAYLELAHVALQGQGAAYAFDVAAVHCSYDSAAARLRQVQTLISYGPRVVLGDFNMQAGSPEYQLMAQHYRDAWAEAATRVGDGNTKSSRIDYVWVRKDLPGIQIAKAEIVDLRVTPADPWPSDHKPLLVSVLIGA